MQQIPVLVEGDRGSFQSLIVRSLVVYNPSQRDFLFPRYSLGKISPRIQRSPATFSVSSLFSREKVSSQKRGLAHINGKPFSVLGAKRSKSRSPARFSISSLLGRENLTSLKTLALIVRSYLFYIIFI